MTKGGTKAKYKDRARDYYRYNVLYNRLASHAKIDARNRSTNASDVNITESKISKYENTNDILKSARNHISKETSGHSRRTRGFSTIDPINQS
tara:strand:- start:687 stop:965 length:279 start_codon:yes stop_codon:yes gene_type:complete